MKAKTLSVLFLLALLSACGCGADEPLTVVSPTADFDTKESAK